MIRITDIIDEAQKYIPQAEVEMIEKAYIFSASVHQGQVRLSGEPYLDSSAGSHLDTGKDEA